MSVDILPLDFTASKTTNRKITTITPINPVGKGHVVCPEWGAFYTDTLVIRDSNNIPLIKNSDYTTAYFYEEDSYIAAKEIMGLILIAPTVSLPLQIDAQYLGGNNVISAKQVKDSLEELFNSDLFKFSFWDIINRPWEFVPSKHTHELWQLLGMGSTVTQTQAINKALATRFNTPNPILDTLNAYADYQIQKTAEQLNDLAKYLSDHYDNEDNPHVDTKELIGLDKLNNWSIANEYECTDINCDDRYQSAYGVYKQINFSVDFGNHLTIPNPHKTTIQDLGGLNKSQWDAVFSNYLNSSGTIENSLKLENMTLADIYGSVGKELNASLYAGDTFGVKYLGSGYDVIPPAALCADQQYRPISDLFDNYPVKQNKIIYIGYFSDKSAFLANLYQNYQNVENGTTILGNLKDTHNFTFLKSDAVTPMDLPSANMGNLMIYTKIDSSWIEI